MTSELAPWELIAVALLIVFGPDWLFWRRWTIPLLAVILAAAALAAS